MGCRENNDSVYRDIPIDSYLRLNALSKEMTGNNIKRIPKFLFGTAALVGDFLRLFGINFPLYSMRYRNMIEDFYAPGNVTIALFGAFSQSYEQNVKETIDWLRGEGKEYFEYWKKHQ
jgi:hypothetical protein